MHGRGNSALLARAFPHTANVAFGLSLPVYLQESCTKYPFSPSLVGRDLCQISSTEFLCRTRKGLHARRSGRYGLGSAFQERAAG